MNIYIIKLLILTLFLFAYFQIFSQENKNIWEKELELIDTVNHKSDFSLAKLNQLKLFQCNDMYFIVYFFRNITNKLYPALIAFDKNGNTILQHEQTEVTIDSLRELGYILLGDIGAYKCEEGLLKINFSQGNSETNRNPSIFKYNLSDGSLYNIDGGVNSSSMTSQSSKSLFWENQLFILGGTPPPIPFPPDKCRIDVYDYIDFHLKYRVMFQLDEFYEFIKDTPSPGKDFLYINDKYFLVYFSIVGSENSIIAKFAIDEIEAADASPGQQINGYMVWHSLYTPIGYTFRDWFYNENDDLVIFHQSQSSGASITILNKNGDVIFNKSIFPEIDSELYKLQRFVKLTYKQGYHAFYGSYSDIENNTKFAIIITNENFEIIEEIIWDSNNTHNFLTDLVEKENGNLLALGYNKYNTNGSTILPYYAEIQPGYITSVTSISKQTLSISPLPSSDFITISGIEPGVNVEIFSLLGIKLFETLYTGKIDISRLSMGVYYVKIGEQVEKFVVGGRSSGLGGR